MTPTMATSFPTAMRWCREVGAYLQKHDPWQHPRSTGHARRVPFYFGGEDWATYVHIEHAHDLGAAEYGKYHAFAKPVFLGEDRYEQDHGTRLDPTHMAYWQRRLFWSWLLAGGSAQYYGRTWWTVHPTARRATALRSAPPSLICPSPGADGLGHRQADPRLVRTPRWSWPTANPTFAGRRTPTGRPVCVFRESDSPRQSE